MKLFVNKEVRRPDLTFSPPMRNKIFLILALVIGIVVIILVQYSIPTLFGADGYLHIRLAKFLRQYGPHYHFHWARYSTFSANFADKDFLFHVLLIPFTFFSNIFFGAKLAAAVFAVLLYLIFWLMLERYCEKKSLIPIFLMAFLCSAPFLQAFSQPRNMVMVIALTFLYTDALIKKRSWVLFVITILYTLTHVSSPYLLLFAFLGEGVRFLNSREFNWKAILAVFLGLVFGFLAHPNFPNNILVFYLNGILVPIFALKWGLELGAEFFPLNSRDLVLGYPLIFIGLLVLVALAVTQERKAKISTQIWLSIAGFFLVFSFFSQRYLVHAYPLILVSLASYISQRWSQPSLKPNQYRRIATVAGVILVFIALFYHTYKDFRERSRSERIYNQHYEAVGNWLASRLPAGEVIFHANWSDSQYFIGLNPQDDYFVTLDPIYMYYWNKRLYNLYREIAFGNNPDPHTALSKIFKVRYGYASKNYFMGLINQVRSDPRFEVMAEDGMGLIFRLK